MAEKFKIKTSYQLKKEARELEIYREFNRLMAMPGAMKTAVEEHVMRQYGIFSRSTIWVIHDLLCLFFPFRHKGGRGLCILVLLGGRCSAPG